MPAKKTATKSKSTTAKKSTAAKKSKSTSSKKSASPKTRTASRKNKAKSKAGNKEVTIDRRSKADRRDETTEKVGVPAGQPQSEKREKVQRRRQIDPTTCERDYSEPEVQFMSAMDEYKRTSGRMFPTCSEVLEVIRDLGYVQLTPAELATVRPETTEEVQSTEEVSEDFEEAELEILEVTC